MSDVLPDLLAEAADRHPDRDAVVMPEGRLSYAALEAESNRLARSLIVRSLRLQKEQGMTESALGADSENISGATRVYEDCGFQVTKRHAIYRKPLA